MGMPYACSGVRQTGHTRTLFTNRYRIGIDEGDAGRNRIGNQQEVALNLRWRAARLLTITATKPKSTVLSMSLRAK